MTIILPPEYHALKDLKRNHVHCINQEEAEKEDIRALRIGILNIMPEAESYEFSLLNPLGRSVLQIVPIWIKLRSHQYGSTSKSHLEKLYSFYDEVLKQEALDGFIITGAPVETLEFEAVRYWNEIQSILQDSMQAKTPILGICWGGLALAYMLGLKKINYQYKHFGVFETLNLDRDHKITGGLDDIFWLPQSRHSGIDVQEMEEASKDSVVHLLCKTIVTGDYPIFASKDHLLLMNLGHFEYSSERFGEEYLRDQDKENVNEPANFDISNPFNRWRGQRNEFFQQWVKFCHERSQKKSF